MFPVMWRLSGKRCLVVGGGEVAERKASSLLEAGADIVIVSPELSPGLREKAEAGLLVWRCKRYEADDMDGSFALVMTAADKREVNARVIVDARRCRVPVNAADDPDGSDFILPAVLRRGRLVLAVSTSGASPSAASAIRDELAAVYGEEYERYFDFLHEYRLKVQQSVKDASKRRRLLREVLEHGLPQWIREGRFELRRAELLDELDRLADAADGSGGGTHG